MLDVSSSAVESQLDVDFADIYANSNLHRYVIVYLFYHPPLFPEFARVLH